VSLDDCLFLIVPSFCVLCSVSLDDCLFLTKAQSRIDNHPGTLAALNTRHKTKAQSRIDNHPGTLNTRHKTKAQSRIDNHPGSTEHKAQNEGTIKNRQSSRPVSLDDCLFLIVPSFFSNMYLLSAQHISGGVGRGVVFCSFQ
jgi:hypothetical protein